MSLTLARARCSCGRFYITEVVDGRVVSPCCNNRTRRFKLIEDGELIYKCTCKKCGFEYYLDRFQIRGGVLSPKCGYQYCKVVIVTGQPMVIFKRKFEDVVQRKVFDLNSFVSTDNGVMKFKVYDNNGNSSVMTDAEIDANGLDRRLYRIVPAHEEERKPIAVLKVLSPDGKGGFKPQFMVAHSMADLKGLRVTTSGHYISEKNIEAHLLLQSNARLKGRELMG